MPTLPQVVAIVTLLGYLVATIMAWAKMNITVNKLEASLTAHLDESSRELERFIVLETRFNESTRVAERDRGEIKDSLKTLEKKLDDIMQQLPKRESDGEK